MITLQNIHLVKLPPMENVEPPSNRKAMPASTRQTSAIAGKSWRRRRTMSARICGVGMLDLPGYDGGGPAPAKRFSNAAPQNRDYETPPTPCRTQNSSRRV